MAKIVCPRCSEVILNLCHEFIAECMKCQTVFEVSNDLIDDANQDLNENE